MAALSVPAPMPSLPSLPGTPSLSSLPSLPHFSIDCLSWIHTLPACFPACGTRKRNLRRPTQRTSHCQSQRNSNAECQSGRTYAIANCVSPFAWVRMLSVSSFGLIRFVMNTTSPDVMSMPATSELAKAQMIRGIFGRKIGRFVMSLTIGKLDTRAMMA
jgi:hypothetical protein